MEIFKKTGVFVAAYIIFMIPTYILPYLGSNSSVMQGVGAIGRATIKEGQIGDGGGAMIGGLFVVHLAILLFLVVITWVRGGAESRRWITTFPVVALVFDLVPGLSLIPLVPTVCHVTTIVLGARGTPKVAIAEQPAK